MFHDFPVTFGRSQKLIGQVRQGQGCVGQRKFHRHRHPQQLAVQNHLGHGTSPALLVFSGGFSPPKNMISSVGMIIPNILKNIWFPSKPPAGFCWDPFLPRFPQWRPKIWPRSAVLIQFEAPVVGKLNSQLLSSQLGILGCNHSSYLQDHTIW